MLTPLTLAFIWSAENVGAMLFWVVVLALGGYGLIRVGKPRVEVTRIRMILNCTRVQAADVLAYLKSASIEWELFLQWTNDSMNKFMPLFAMEGSGQFIATWGETRLAILGLVKKRAMKKRWSSEDSIAAVATEILAQRHAAGKNPMHPRDVVAESVAKIQF